MILNKKYKCPVCLDESFSHSNTRSYNLSYYILCDECKSQFKYTRSSQFESYIVLFFILIPSFIYNNFYIHILFYAIAGVGMTLYLRFFGELQRVELEPQPRINIDISLNEFLDNLINESSKKI